MNSDSNQSFFNSNISWLKSNLPEHQSNKLFSNFSDSETLLKLSQDDFELEYTLPVFKALETPRRISFHPVESSIVGECDANSIESAASSAIRSTNFSLLSYAFAAFPSTTTAVPQQLNHNLLLLGSYALPAVFNKILAKDVDIIRYQTIILAESSVSSFLSSLQYFNFAQFIDLLRELKISFHLVLEDTYELLTENIYDYFSKVNPFLIFGLDVASQPLVSPLLVKLEDWLLSQVGLGYRFTANLGFSTDELNQCINSLITHNKYPQLTGYRSCPFADSNLSIVTGSGPSLDNNLDWIKRYQGSLTIFSAGSSVKSLLSHNIVPSFIVVSERNSIIYDYLLEVSLEFPALSDVILIGSDTIDTRIFSLFKQFYIFQRPLSAVSPLFYEFRSSILPSSGPESVNACAETALMIGSSNLLLLGCDFAAPNKSEQRSKNAFGVSPRDFDMPVRGNKKRTVFSQLSLLNAKESLERIIQVFPTVNILRSGEGVSMCNENYVDLSPDVHPNDLCDDSALPYVASFPDVPFSDRIDERILTLVASIEEYIELIISTVNQFDEWNLELERKLTSFFSVDLVDKEETYFYLASRRLMRHYFFHLVHQLYLHRYSESTFSIAKSEFVKRAQLIRSLLICILSELKGNISSLSSDSDPLTVLSTNIANSLG